MIGECDPQPRFGERESGSEPETAPQTCREALRGGRRSHHEGEDEEHTVRGLS